MTPPLTPPTRPLAIVSIGVIAVAIAMPCAERDDWIGWIALATIGAVAVALWGLLICGFTRAIIDWWRNRSQSD
jgi:hypothetical protein